MAWVNYKEYLKSPRWKRRVTMVDSRCNGFCERCKLNPMEEVHHKHYRNLGNEPLEDLVGLCRGCHRFIHGKTFIDPRCPMKDIDEAMRRFLKDGRI